MKKKKKVEPSPKDRVAENEGGMFLRLCHVCLHLNESGSEILQCDKCGSFLSLQPLFGSYSENDLHPPLEDSSEMGADEDAERLDPPQCLQGLEVVW